MPWETSHILGWDLEGTIYLRSRNELEIDQPSQGAECFEAKSQFQNTQPLIQARYSRIANVPRHQQEANINSRQRNITSRTSNYFY